MRPPRFRIRTLMIAVAVAAGALGAAIAGWRLIIYVGRLIVFSRGI